LPLCHDDSILQPAAATPPTAGAAGLLTCLSSVNSTVLTKIIALLCVCGIAAGQVLFKIGANALTENGGKLLSRGGAVVAAALVLYAVTTLAWIWVLQRSELGKIYPLMALAFILVPVASHFLFGESFSWRYGVGCVLLVAGIVLTSGS
jgi:drug/metabolite transporter (DMT)-like permease